MAAQRDNVTSIALWSSLLMSTFLIRSATSHVEYNNEFLFRRHSFIADVLTTYSQAEDFILFYNDFLF